MDWTSLLVPKAGPEEHYAACATRAASNSLPADEVNRALRVHRLANNSASNALRGRTAFEWITFAFNSTAFEWYVFDLDRPAFEWNISSCTAFEHVIFDSIA